MNPKLKYILIWIFWIVIIIRICIAGWNVQEGTATGFDKFWIWYAIFFECVNLIDRAIKGKW